MQNTSVVQGWCAELVCPFPYIGAACDTPYASGEFLVHHCVSCSLFFVCYSSFAYVGWSSLKQERLKACVRDPVTGKCTFFLRVQLIYIVLLISSVMSALNSFDIRGYAGVKPFWIESLVLHVSVTLLILLTIIVSTIWVSVIQANGSRSRSIVKGGMKCCALLTSCILLLAGVSLPLLELHFTPATSDPTGNVPVVFRGSSILHYRGVSNVHFNTAKNVLNTVVASLYTAACTWYGFQLISQLTSVPANASTLRSSRRKAVKTLLCFMGALTFGDSLLAVYTIIRAIQRERSPHLPYFLEKPVCSVAQFYIHMPNIFQLVAMCVLCVLLRRNKNQYNQSESSTEEPSEITRYRMTDTDHLDDDIGDEVVNAFRTSVESMEIENSRRRNSWEHQNSV